MDVSFIRDLALSHAHLAVHLFSSGFTAAKLSDPSVVKVPNLYKAGLGFAGTQMCKSGFIKNKYSLPGFNLS